MRRGHRDSEPLPPVLDPISHLSPADAARLPALKYSKGTRVSRINPRRGGVSVPLKGTGRSRLWLGAGSGHRPGIRSPPPRGRAPSRVGGSPKMDRQPPNPAGCTGPRGRWAERGDLAVTLSAFGGTSGVRLHWAPQDLGGARGFWGGGAGAANVPSASHRRESMTVSLLLWPILAAPPPHSEVNTRVCGALRAVRVPVPAAGPSSGGVAVPLTTVTARTQKTNS